MTLRAVLLGLFGAATICGYTYFNDQVIKQTTFISNNFPVSVYGGLLIFILLLNPLLLRLGRRFALTGRELAVILAMTLAACCIPGSGLMRTFTTTLMNPHKFVDSVAGWKGDRPELTLDSVLDWQELGQALQQAPLPPPLAQFKEQAPPPVLQILKQAAAGTRPARDHRQAVIDAFNDVLTGAPLPPPGAPPPAYLPVASQSAYERRTAEFQYLQTKLDELDAATQEAAQELAAATQRYGALAKTLKQKEAELQERRTAHRAQLDALLEADGPGEALDEKRQRLHRELMPLEQEIADLERHIQPLEEARHRVKHLEVAAVELPKAIVQEQARLNRLLLDANLPDVIRPRQPSATEKLPGQMLADPRANQSDALFGFIQGMGIGTKHMPSYKLPWYAWIRTLKFWVPVILTFWFALIALSVVVHRQWSDHEQLPYPIATFADSLLPEEGAARGTVFRNQLFWLGAVVVFVIHMNNYTCEWLPGWIRIPTGFRFNQLKDMFPTLAKGGAWWFFYPQFFFTVIAFAYFLSTDVSLSLGVGPILYCYLIGMLAGYGVQLGRAGALSLDPPSYLAAGAYLGILLAILYTGRQYYKSVFARALLLPCRDAPESQSIWAARLFILSLGTFVACLVVAGLAWPVALFYAIGLVMIFLVMSRIIAETGLFFIQPYFSPCILLVGIVGAKAIGPDMLLILFMLTAVLKIDPRESIMPFMVNSMKLLDRRRVSLGKTGALCVVAVMLGLAIALFATLYFQYDRGATRGGWSWRIVPQAAFKTGQEVEKELASQDALAESRSLQGLARLGAISPNRDSLIALGLGLGLTLAFTAGRLHFPKWPLHPVLFLVWMTYPATRFAWCFLVGWLIKVLVMKYGGSGVYQKLKPLMIGLIAGDMLGGIVPSIVGLVYYLVTGKPSPSFNIMHV